MLDRCSKLAGQVDVWCHLWDLTSDAEALMSRTNAKVYAVRRNCDYFGGSARRYESEAVVELGGARILMMHGHTRGVKSSAMNACYAARECGAQILLFGHTHRPLVDWDGTLWVMNPGSIRDRRTYGVITLEGGKIDCAAQTLTL